MKKFFIATVACVCFASVAHAIITVKDNGQANKYPAGSVVRVYASHDVTVEYNGTTIVIPKNTRVTLREEMVNGERSLSIRAEDLVNFKLGDLTISAKGSSFFSFNPSSKQIDISNGSLLITDKKGEPSLFYAGDTYKPGKTQSYNAPDQNTDDGSDTEGEQESELLPPSQPLQDNTQYEQTSKNIKEEKTLSESAPL